MQRVVHRGGRALLALPLGRGRHLPQTIGLQVIKGHQSVGYLVECVSIFDAQEGKRRHVYRIFSSQNDWLRLCYCVVLQGSCAICFSVSHNGMSWGSLERKRKWLNKGSKDVKVECQVSAEGRGRTKHFIFISQHSFYLGETTRDGLL